MPLWLLHLLHLARDGWLLLVSATSTNTLGFIVWTVALTIVGWLSAVVHTVLKRRKIERRGAFLLAVRESLMSGFLLLMGVLALTGVAWAFSVSVTVYRDHQRLVGQISDLSQFAARKEQIEHDLNAANSKADNWQQAYLGVSKGERVPDRILDSENTDRLHVRLMDYAKNSGDRRYSTVKIAPAFYEDQESSDLALYLLRVFKDSHWSAQWEARHDKNLKALLNLSPPVGIAIYSDDPHNQANWIMWLLKDAGVDSYVAIDVPQGFKGDTDLCWVQTELKDDSALNPEYDDGPETLKRFHGRLCQINCYLLCVPTSPSERSPAPAYLPCA